MEKMRETESRRGSINVNRSAVDHCFLEPFGPICQKTFFCLRGKFLFVSLFPKRLLILDANLGRIRGSFGYAAFARGRGVVSRTPANSCLSPYSPTESLQKAYGVGTIKTSKDSNHAFSRRANVWLKYSPTTKRLSSAIGLVCARWSLSLKADASTAFTSSKSVESYIYMTRA